VAYPCRLVAYPLASGASPHALGARGKRRGDRPREVYLGWVDPAREYTSGRFTLSLDSRTVWFSRLADRQEVGDMPGAYSTGGYVAFRIYKSSGVDNATEAARKVKCQL